MNEYTSYPQGYNKLAVKIVPLYMKPIKGLRNMMMRMLVKILSEC